MSAAGPMLCWRRSVNAAMLCAMPGKLIRFDKETLAALEELAGDRMASFQDLADEAFADLLHKHERPVGFRQSLKKSIKGADEPKGRRRRR
jgi:hypothetical protein